jgi:hypothetical protein
VVDPFPPPRRCSSYPARSGFTGADLGASRPELGVQADPPPELELPLDAEPLEPEEEEDPEDEPESRGTADPVVGESAGRERSWAESGARLRAKAAAARPIVDL